MSIYANDPRVVRISDDEYWLPSGDKRWRIRFEKDRWHAYDQDGRHTSTACAAAADLDLAIFDVIGAPQ